MAAPQDYILPEVIVTGSYSGGAPQWSPGSRLAFSRPGGTTRPPLRKAEREARMADFIDLWELRQPTPIQEWLPAPFTGETPEEIDWLLEKNYGPLPDERWLSDLMGDQIQETFAPPMPEVLPEVIITAPRTVAPASLPFRIGGALGRAGLGLIALFLTPMPSGGPRTGELKEPPRAPRKPVSPEDDPIPNWEDMLHEEPWRPKQPFVPEEQELPEVVITAPRTRPLELPFYEPFFTPFSDPFRYPAQRPGRQPTPNRRAAPGRAPEPDRAPGDLLDPLPNPFTFTPGNPDPFSDPWSPAAPDVRASPRRPPAPGPDGDTRPTPSLPDLPGQSPDRPPAPDFAPWDQPLDLKPPNEADSCQCEKPKKKKKKEKRDRAECFEYKVRQLARGQLTMDRKLIACETREMYGAMKKQKKPKPKKPKPGTNPFPQLWS